MLKVKPIMLLRSLALVAVVLVPVTAHAQDQRLRLSFGVATTAGGINSEGAIAASVGYRFLDRLSFDVEVTAADGVTDRFAGIQPFDGGSATGGFAGFGITTGESRPSLFAEAPAGTSLPFDEESRERDGRTVISTFGFRYDLPSQASRFVPYVSGGVGVARTRGKLDVSPASVVSSTTPGVNSTIYPTAEGETLTSTGLVTGAGVGASIRMFRRVSADLDARYFRLDQGRHFGRLGAGVSYRF